MKKNDFAAHVHSSQCHVMVETVDDEEGHSLIIAKTFLHIPNIHRFTFHSLTRDISCTAREEN